MNATIIAVENLGKQYRLNHRGEVRQYVALRDVIAEKAKRLLRSRKPAQKPGGAQQFWALKDVSFEVRQGEVVGIVGRNGAGKSTLLKILSRITEPTAGRVRIRGRVASLLEVGTGFHPELTGRENIYLNGAILGMARSEVRRKFDEIVAFAGVEAFLDTPVKRYSSGMYVRLAFAVAAHLEPEILVVDEVLAVGDAEFQKKCLRKMRDVSEGGRTVLFVSHNLSAVQTLCGSGLLLERGRVRSTGRIDDVTREYLASLRDENPEVAEGTPLGASLQLGRLDFHPPIVESGGPLSIRVQLLPKAAEVIKELSILIHSEYGARIAILDLRPQGFDNLPLAGEPVDFQVVIRSLPLVEGDYRVGLYLATSGYTIERPDLALFTVAASSGNAIRYAPQYRGVVELDFSVRRTARRAQATSLDDSAEAAQAPSANRFL